MPQLRLIVLLPQAVLLKRKKIQAHQYNNSHNSVIMIKEEAGYTTDSQTGGGGLRPTRGTRGVPCSDVIPSIVTLLGTKGLFFSPLSATAFGGCDFSAGLSKPQSV